MKLSIFLVLGFAYQTLAPRTTEAQVQSNIDPAATVVDLRVSCALPDDPAEPGVQQILDNCFETSGEVTDWLWGSGGRNSEPNSLDPVTVRVGPGTFDPFVCVGTGMRGFVSVEGAGRDLTRFVSDDTRQAPAEFVCEGGVNVTSCTSLSFRNVTTQGVGTGARWFGEGNSQWQDVDFLASNEVFLVCRGHALAWYDRNDAVGAHLFSNCRFDSTGGTHHAVAFFNNAAEVRAYGSDFKVLRAGSVTGGDNVPIAVFSRSTLGMSIFVSTVRAKVDVGSTGNAIVGLSSENSGVISMYGGIVNVDASDHLTGVAIGVRADSGEVHTAETAFALDGADTARIQGNGVVRSPFVWPGDPEFPDIASQTGGDLFVKTNEGPGQNEARLFVFDSSCSPTQKGQAAWRNMTTGNCI